MPPSKNSAKSLLDLRVTYLRHPPLSTPVAPFLLGARRLVAPCMCVLQNDSVAFYSRCITVCVAFPRTTQQNAFRFIPPPPFSFCVAFPIKTLAIPIPFPRAENLQIPSHPTQPQPLLPHSPF